MKDFKTNVSAKNVHSRMDKIKLEKYFDKWRRRRHVAQGKKILEINEGPEILKYKKNKNNVLNFKQNDNKGKIKHELLLKELKKNVIEIINKKTVNEKTFINNEVNNLKKSKKNEINSLKSFFENEINLLKEEILKMKMIEHLLYKGHFYVLYL